MEAIEAHQVTPRWPAGDLLRRLVRFEDAAQAYARAVELAPSATERAFLRRRIDSCAAGS